MRITVAHHSPASCQRWRDALARELPDAEVDIWGQGRAGSADYAIAWAAPAKDFFDQHDRLKAFFCTGAGVEKLISSPAMPPALPVIRLEDAGMGAQMADYCVYAVLHWLRRRSEYDEQQRARTWKQLPANDLANWPIGVFGLGVLGVQVAHAFRALGFNVNGFARSAHDHPGIRAFAEQGGAGDFAAFMRASRVLVILAPLTAVTQDRFNRETLALLPPSSYVINVARGGLLVAKDLIELLDSGHLAGAAAPGSSSLVASEGAHRAALFCDHDYRAVGTAGGGEDPATGARRIGQLRRGPAARLLSAAGRRPDRQVADFGADRAFVDEEFRNRDWQCETSRPGAAGIHEQHAVLLGDRRFVRMACDDRSDAVG